MPTPSDNTLRLNSASIAEEIRTTCPPEVERLPAWRDSPDSSTAESDVPENALSPASASGQSVLTRSDDAISPSQPDPLRVRSNTVSGAPAKSLSKPDDEPVGGRLSPPAGEPSCPANPSPSVTAPSTTSLLSYEFSNIRLLPNYTSSFLRPGSKFTGTQQSDRQVYNVDVEIKHVDMVESYLCGYLRIQGLTEDHPTLTTFFEGEIIGNKHTFKTRNEAWGATEKTDMIHWARFPAWHPLAKQAKRPDFTYRNFAQREHIFMRWKEYFLVPDHRVRTISGASFEGFYYICFNQVEGTVTGIYFHAKSEKYQQLELKHVEDHGCTPAIEFR